MSKQKRVEKFEINFIPESINCDPHYQVKGDGRDLATFKDPEKARKFIKDWKNTIIIRTKRIDSYFQGVIRSGQFPIDGLDKKFYIDCQSYSGGRPPILDILDFKADSEYDLMVMLAAFKRKHNLIIERI